MAFDPKKHMMNLQGKEYLPVAPRRVWALELHPDWRIITEELFADEVNGIYRFKATISNGDGTIVATGHGRETAKGFALGPYEKAETIAIGRALALAGVGTLEAQELVEDGASKIADAPAKPADNAPKIGITQIEELRDLLKAAGVKESQLLAYHKLTSLADMTMGQYEGAKLKAQAKIAAKNAPEEEPAQECHDFDEEVTA